MVVIYDTTLRDGAQTPYMNLSLEGKLRITGIIDSLGVPYIEGGWPGSNKRDTLYFQRVKELPLKAKIVAFGMTSRTEDVEKDELIEELVRADTPVVAIVGKAWNLHVYDVLRKPPGDYLRTIKNTVDYLKSLGKEVVFDAEHAFDGYYGKPEYGIKGNPDYVMKALEAAKSADWIVLCDTNGGRLPHEIRYVTSLASKELGRPIGIHCHDDCGLALANTLAGIEAGATQAQVTANGLGERAGNANLWEVAMALKRMGIYTPLAENSGEFTEAAKNIARITGINVPDNAPYVGGKSFYHTGGLHSDAMIKNPKTYEHMNPAEVGNERRFPITEQAGRAAVIEEAKRLGYNLKRNDVVLAEIMKGVDASQAMGDAQLYLMLHKLIDNGGEPFDVLDGNVQTRFSKNPEASIKVRVNGDVYHEISGGDGPVNAFDLALRKALAKKYPEIEGVRLVDYSVRLPASETGTAAKVDVSIEFQNNGNGWTSMASGTDIIEASERALIEGYKYYILRR